MSSVLKFTLFQFGQVVTVITRLPVASEKPYILQEYCLPFYLKMACQTNAASGQDSDEHEQR